MTIRPPNDRGAMIYDRAPMTVIKNLHSDGSESTPDTSGYSKQVLPPSAMRAGIFKRRVAQPTKYLMPDGSVWEGSPVGGGGSGGDRQIKYINTIPGVVTGDTSESFIQSLLGKGVVKGDRLFGEVAFSDMPFTGNGELTLDVFDIGTNWFFGTAQLFSSNTAPHFWTAVVFDGGPIAWQSAGGGTSNHSQLTNLLPGNSGHPISGANSFVVTDDNGSVRLGQSLEVDSNLVVDGNTQMGGNLEVNGNLILHGNETIDGNLMIGDKEVATRQFLLSVTPPRDAADRSGITMHVVNNGAAVYSFFSGMDTLTETITIPPLDQFIIADSDDFPELLWYQGDPLIETGAVISLDSTGIVEQSVKVIVGDGMAIMNFDAENPLVLNESSIFMFNKVLLLGSPEDAQGAAIQAAQAATRTKSYTTCAGFLEDMRVRVAKLRGSV